MKIGLKIKRFFYRRVMKPNVMKIYEKENSVRERANAICANENAPIRFDIPLHIFDFAEQGKPINIANRLTILPMVSNILNIKKAYKTLNKNREDPKLETDDLFINDLREFCSNNDITSVGFTKLPKNLIFREKAVLFDNAIVLTMEMDRDRIALAPHLKTGEEIMQTYNRLGIVANRVALYLRRHGYAAQASHPLGGIVVYPPLAKKAGLGWNGKHGLLITPECGARVRIAAVFTNISNLPFATENPHGWIPEYCATCGKCIRKCPTKSLFETPIFQENGLITHNDSDKCFPEFAANYGCTICIKVCPFSTIGYEKLKKIWKLNKKSPRI